MKFKQLTKNNGSVTMIEVAAITTLGLILVVAAMGLVKTGENVTSTTKCLATGSAGGTQVDFTDPNFDPSACAALAPTPDPNATPANTPQPTTAPTSVPTTMPTTAPTVPQVPTPRRTIILEGDV